jgi:tripartite-type tricarboxylate transporter receptor subunit TctC
MNPSMRRVLLGFSAFLIAHSPVVCAQQFPTKPLRIMVGFAPGGTNDILARVLSAHMGESLGQPIVVENRAGAVGVIASDAVAKAAPDGHTLLLGSLGTQGILPALRKSMPYDPVKDLLPVSLVGLTGTVLAVRQNLPAQTVRDLIALAKASPGKLTFASGGSGSVMQMAAELFKLAAGVDMLDVPYKGNAPALADVASGQVDVIFSPTAPAQPLEQAGKLRFLGVSTTQRLPGLANTAPIAELGLPGYEVAIWYGLFATGGTPANIASRLAGEVRKALAVPKVREHLLAEGLEAAPNTPAEFAKFVNDELAKWARVVKSANIQPN